MQDLQFAVFRWKVVMTICNMSIESGARGGLIAPDETTFEYIKGREYAPIGEDFEKAVEAWKELKTDDDAFFDLEYTYDAGDIQPMITYGTNPGMGEKIAGNIPGESEIAASGLATFKKSLAYMGFEAGASYRRHSGGLCLCRKLYQRKNRGSARICLFC